jgi:hypothetical protein
VLVVGVDGLVLLVDPAAEAPPAEATSTSETPTQEGNVT